jgi:hypothetical protein
MAASNPFVYGEIVTSEAFADREQERDRLRRDLASGQKVFLISPRRYGKSSLVRDVLRGLARENVLTVEVTVAASSSYVGFLESYARALVAADADEPPAPLDDRPALGRASAGAPRRGPGRRSRLQRVVSLGTNGARRRPARHRGLRVTRPHRRGAPSTARDRARRVPGLTAFDGDTAEQALRAAVQDQRAVGYVFAGSEPSLMERMISPKRPFYKAGPVVGLQKIDPDVFGDWLEARFKSSGIKAEAGLGAAIVDLAGNVPYDVQRLAHEAWDDLHDAGRRTATLDDLHVTLTRLLGEQHTVFEESWQRLTLAQRAALRAIVLEDGREMLSADVRMRHRLSGASSVQAALTALVKQDVVMKDGGSYVVTDSLYREWVARKTF